MPGAGGCWLAGPPPGAGAVLQRGPGSVDFGRWFSEPGSWLQGAGGGLESSSWAMEREAVLGVISQKVWSPPSLPCRPPWWVACWLSCVCVAPALCTLGKVTPGEGNIPPAFWTLFWRMGEADAPQGGAAWRPQLPGAHTHSCGAGQPWDWCPPSLQAKWSELCSAGACLPCPSCSWWGPCPPCLPEAEQGSNPTKQGEGAVHTL